MIYINEEKLKNIELLKNNFYVVIDFDKTLTDVKSLDSWDASGKELGIKFKEESNILYKKYAPIELDYDISFEEKNKAMEEWYYGVLELFYKYHLTSDKLEKSVKTSELIFRSGAKEFLYQMYKENIPVIIVSAGIGNTIQKFLEINNCFYNNINIISNFIKFDNNGNMKKIEGKLIHTLNKTVKGHITEELKKKLVDRENIILLGDLVEDKNMIEKEKLSKAITIGFLNKNIEENLEFYKKNFDIVLTKEEATFEMVNKLVF